MRISQDEIETVVEMDVANCIYDGCEVETYEDYVKKVMEDLFSMKFDRRYGTICKSNENRFAGTASTEKRVRKAVKSRLDELVEAGNISSYEKGEKR